MLRIGWECWESFNSTFLLQKFLQFHQKFFQYFNSFSISNFSLQANIFQGKFLCISFHLMEGYEELQLADKQVVLAFTSILGAVFYHGKFVIKCYEGTPSEFYCFYRLCSSFGFLMLSLATRSYLLLYLGVIGLLILPLKWKKESPKKILDLILYMFIPGT